MRIAQVHIRGFRCLVDLRVDFDDLTALVGSGGVGKSTVLNALDWFFHGGDLEERDRHLAVGGEEPVDEVVVAVTFRDLNGADREALGAYVQGGTTTLTRSWSESDGQKLSGTALVFPDFMPIRAISGARDLRNAYVALHRERGEELDLPAPARSADEIRTAMEVWEREHPDLCELMAAEARHLRGFTGTPTLESRFDYVLVSATARAAEAYSDDRRTGILARLLSVLEGLDDASLERIEGLQATAMSEITQIVGQARGAELVSISSALTKRVRDYVPGAAVRLEDEISAPRSPDISVRARVSDRGGHPIDPDLQGHGLQRALVIALLHEIAEREIQSTDAGDPDQLRTLMLAIEEPELYQHPLQARALARTLDDLARGDGPRPIQVAYSTHSPSFSGPALFSDLRLCRRPADAGTSCVAADPEGISAELEAVGRQGDTAASVHKALAESLREAIFAAAVIVCEGPTDGALVEGVGDLQGGLDADGVAVAACGGKPTLLVAAAILKQLRIPHLVLFDGDAANGLPSEAEKNRQLLALCDEAPDGFPARAVRDRSANWQDTLESDLETLWPDLTPALEAVAGELGVSAEKNPRVYRQAAARAGEPPEFLLDLLDAARRLAD